jgi:hypothetical protein
MCVYCTLCTQVYMCTVHCAPAGERSAQCTHGQPQRLCQHHIRDTGTCVCTVHCVHRYVCTVLYTVRLLVGGQLNVHMASPSVSVSIISETQVCMYCTLCTQVCVYCTVHWAAAGGRSAQCPHGQPQRLCQYHIRNTGTCVCTVHCVHRYVCTVLYTGRLLVGGQLNVHMASPRVSVRNTGMRIILLILDPFFLQG